MLPRSRSRIRSRPKMSRLRIPAFLHLLLIYLFKWHKVYCAGNFVPLNCRKNKVDAIFKQIKNNHKDSGLLMTASAFQMCCLPLWINTWHATHRQAKSGTKLPKSTVIEKKSIKWLLYFFSKIHRHPWTGDQECPLPRTQRRKETLR